MRRMASRARASDGIRPDSSSDPSAVILPKHWPKTARALLFGPFYTSKPLRSEKTPTCRKVDDDIGDLEENTMIEEVVAEESPKDRWTAAHHFGIKAHNIEGHSRFHLL